MDATETLKEKEDEQLNDPYAYTKRAEFTSENFKIEIHGLPRYFPVGQVKKLLNEKFDLGAHKVKPHGPNRSWAYVNFRNEEARDKAIKVLDGLEWKNKILTVTTANPAKDPLLSTRGESTNPEDEKLSIEERITKAVTNYAEFSYEEQLKKKEASARSVMKKFGFQLSDANYELNKFVSWNQKHRGGQICDIEPIVPSPVIENYRNKCEFTVGINPETMKPTVGFRLSSYRDGSVKVGSVSHLRNIPMAMKKVVQLFESYVIRSGLEPFDPISHNGVWRQLTCRTTSNDDLLIIVVMHPQDSDESCLKNMKDELVQYFIHGEGKEAKVTSLYCHILAQREKGQPNNYELLWGKASITETISGKDFRVSPDSFLQVNTPGCEVLYKTIGDLANLDDKTVLLDICCGTGTIGISLAADCKKAVGVDIVSQAIQDARLNAENNGVTNVHFYDGKAEDYINLMLEANRLDSCVAVVDPPRAGLHNSVVCALRKAENLNRFVFASCDPRAAIQNFLAFGRATSKNYKGTPFIPVKAIPVDMFPHTPHYELIIVFERYDQEKWKRIMEGNPRPCDQTLFDSLTSTSTNEEEIKSDQMWLWQRMREDLLSILRYSLTNNDRSTQFDSPAYVDTLDHD